MQIKCPHCEWLGKVKAEIQGKKVKCPKCKQVFVAKPNEDPEKTVALTNEQIQAQLAANQNKPKPKATPPPAPDQNSEQTVELTLEQIEAHRNANPPITGGGKKAGMPAIQDSKKVGKKTGKKAGKKIGKKTGTKRRTTAARPSKTAGGKGRKPARGKASSARKGSRKPKVSKETNFGKLWLIGLICCLTGILIPIGAIIFLVLLYRLWEIIQDGDARTTPGKAVGLMFIPFFNIYWFFIAYCGLTTDMNNYCEERDIDTPEVPSAFALISVIVTIVLGIPLFVILLKMLSTCATAIQEAKNTPATEDEELEE